VRRFIGLAATRVFVSVAAIAGAATPEVVLDEPGVFEGPSSASEGYLVWSSNSEAKPNRFHSYVMADGGSPVRIDPPGTQSFGAAIDGTTIAYEELSADVNDIHLFDAVTEERTAPPAGVNTANIEHRPSLSGDWLLFTRINANRVPFREAWVKIVLFDLTGGTGNGVVIKIAVQAEGGGGRAPAGPADGGGTPAPRSQMRFR
jgi:hypothetical protein